MCNFFSGIFTEKKFLYDPYEDHHENLVEKHGLKDDKLPPDFVRVELLNIGPISNLSPANWRFSVTHADSVPSWWTPAKAQKAEAEMRKVFLSKVAAKRIFSTGENKALENCIYYASDRAMVEASDQATVRASDRATVRASDRATVEAFDQATVRASDRATVEAFDRATVEAFDQAMVEASDQATVRASDQATVEASDQATVEAFDQATVEASDQATVRAFDQATVEGNRNSIIRSWSFKKITVTENSIHIDYHSGKPKIITANPAITLEIVKTEA